MPVRAYSLASLSSASKFALVIQRSYAIKQAFYETRRAEGDENPKMEQARQEEEKEVKLEVLLHEVSAPDAGVSHCFVLLPSRLVNI